MHDFVNFYLFNVNFPYLCILLSLSICDFSHACIFFPKTSTILNLQAWILACMHFQVATNSIASYKLCSQCMCFFLFCCCFCIVLLFVCFLFCLVCLFLGRGGRGVVMTVSCWPSKMISPNLFQRIIQREKYNKKLKPRIRQ